MRHPTDGVLRRLIDEPVAVADADREHVASCATCLAGVAAARDDAAAVGTALRTADAGDLDVDRAWAGLTNSLARNARTTAVAARPARSTRWQGLLRRPAVAALGFAIVLSGAGVAAANDWLPIFRTEQITAVEVDPADLVAVPDLTAYGDVELTGEGDLRTVPDATAAESETGLDVPQVTSVPTGVSGEPTLQVADQVTATFTFSAARAAEAAAQTGQPLPEPPAGLDGSRIRIMAGPAVVQLWTREGDLPTLVVARAVAPTVLSDSVPFETVRDYLLSLPGLPRDLAEQLRTLSADGTTLPLPVPADLATSEPAEVGGRPATVITARNGLLAGVVWVDDGVVTAVFGSVDADEALSVAGELR